MTVMEEAAILALWELSWQCGKLRNFDDIDQAHLTASGTAAHEPSTNSAPGEKNESNGAQEYHESEELLIGSARNHTPHHDDPDSEGSASNEILVEGAVAVEETGSENKEGVHHNRENGDCLPADLMRSIFERLPMCSILRAGAVCRKWHKHAHNPELWAASFVRKWELDSISSSDFSPVSTSFWASKDPFFVLPHAVSGTDTVAGLAVRYNVQVMELRRVNNMMSDHGIYSRSRLLIPIPPSSRAQLLKGMKCMVELDPYARREVVVVYHPEATLPTSPPPLSEK